MKEPTVTATVCQGCRTEREKHSLPVRMLRRLPSQVTASVFHRTNLPLLLCEHCDGDVIENAMRSHFPYE